MGAAASSQHSVTSTDVEDLWLEILKRLPVKSLCKLRCVCKSWNALFLSDFFITLHHDFMVSEIPTNHNSYLMENPLDRAFHTGFAVYQPHQRHAGSECITNVGLPFPVQMHRQKGNHLVVDVIHGVACLVRLGGTPIYVWNPATHKSICLTKQITRIEGWKHYFGFGFSAAKSDFMVVVLLPRTPYYDLYSVKDSLWRRCSIPDDVLQGYTAITEGRFVNGTIFWIVGKNIGRDNIDRLLHVSMWSFDCEREEFKIREMPQELRNLRILKLFKYNDKLSVLRRGGSSELALELWVMEDVANNYTWNKLFNINNLGMLPARLFFNDLLVDQDGNMVVTRRNELSSVDLPFESGASHQPLNGYVFTESLFLTNLSSGKQPSSSSSSSSLSSHKGLFLTDLPGKPSDERIYFGHRFRALKLLNFCLDLAGKLMASALVSG